MTRLLVLRPQPGADATAVRARGLGLDPLVAPMFEIRPLAWEAPDPEGYDAVLMTSANAARHGGAGLTGFRHLPLYAVGAATAESARSAGFGRVLTGPSDGAAALAMAVAAGHRRIFHPVGRDHVALDPGPAQLTRCIVYASERRALPALPPEEKLVALLHSIRAARLFAEQAGERSRFSIAALSPAVAAAAGAGWRAVAIADQPDDESLLAVAARLCDQAQGKESRA